MKFFSLANLKALPVMAYTILIGTCISQAAHYMLWPFLVLILDRRFNLPPSEIGLYLSTTVLTSVVFGPYIGFLADKFSRHGIFMLGCLIRVIAFIYLSFAEHQIAFFIGILFVGLGGSTLNATGKAILVDVVENTILREFALQLRYFLVNVSGAIGPLLGVWFGIKNHKILFLIVAFVYVLFTVAFVTASRNSYSKALHSTHQNVSFVNVLKFISSDKPFILLLFANIIMMFTYAHYDSSLIMYLNRLKVEGIAGLISLLILVNTLVVIFLQFPLLELMRKMSISARMYCAITLMFFAQLVFAFNPGQMYYGWLVGIFLLSLGEVIAFPILNILIDRMSPEHLKGSYYGASTLFGLGVPAAPLIGGLLVERIGGRGLYLVTAFLCVLIIILYIYSMPLNRNKKQR